MLTRKGRDSRILKIGIVEEGLLSSGFGVRVRSRGACVALDSDVAGGRLRKDAAIGCYVGSAAGPKTRESEVVHVGLGVVGGDGSMDSIEVRLDLVRRVSL